ncbi:hypothetical protein FR483_n076L [Paramecium bursaria Chlorella virus FR483]|uniref:Uncharacterized protein n076L n=1 Tax=Paramecium bursaria Chlorella virus FR483 TaxID=399781 RepID=A7J6D0_PBCVF|nr:hypothetical protein FR483_n076L [Paramecium bursaria Chlorella virus FR483]ABT15361.1 hypothetical protein FR483_n076L [Paramecium bursaria Chlorella virus FR483]
MVEVDGDLVIARQSINNDRLLLVLELCDEILVGILSKPYALGGVYESIINEQAYLGVEIGINAHNFAGRCKVDPQFYFVILEGNQG